MPAPAISHLICTSALVMLIFLLPFFYATVIDNIRNDMICRELREIADYVSNTIANLYFLVNSTETLNVALQKELVYLPSNVENFVYILEIAKNGEHASRVVAYLKDKPSVTADAWLAPGLKIDNARNNPIVSCGLTVTAGCQRNVTGVYVWICYG
ncbi:MAG: hypothetical protein QW717_03520 [Candidatus Bathyarchaeia archaeon]